MRNQTQYKLSHRLVTKSQGGMIMKCHWQCPECQGAGQIQSAESCFECHAADEVIYLDDEKCRKSEICRKCKGKKVVPALITCPVCKGEV